MYFYSKKVLRGEAYTSDELNLHLSSQPQCLFSAHYVHISCLYVVYCVLFHWSAHVLQILCPPRASD